MVVYLLIGEDMISVSDFINFWDKVSSFFFLLFFFFTSGLGISSAGLSDLTDTLIFLTSSPWILFMSFSYFSRSLTSSTGNEEIYYGCSLEGLLSIFLSILPSAAYVFLMILTSPVLEDETFDFSFFSTSYLGSLDFELSFFNLS